MPAIFQALTRSITYIVSLMMNSKHSLETSVIQRLDFFFHIQDFFFLQVLRLFLKSASLSRMQFCAVSSLLLTATKVACFVLVSILPFQSTVFGKYTFLYLS